MKRSFVRAQNEEVLYTTRQNPRLDKEFIECLKSTALENDRKRVRICAHSDTENTLHEMVIVHTKGTYVQPHKHPGKSESFHLIEGSLKLVVFDDSGEILDVVTMGDYTSGGVFYHRLSDSLFHSVIFLSDFAVFHETTNGPFRDGETMFPTWAPAADRPEDQVEYMRHLEGRIALWRE